MLDVLLFSRAGGAGRDALFREVGDDAVEDGEAEGYFFEEGSVVRDEDEARVVGPERAETLVERDGFGIAFGADRVAGLDAESASGGGLEENHGVVAREFAVDRGADGLKK